MIQKIFESANPPFVWIDVVDPSYEDLERVAGRHGLPETAVRDCLDPEHLPKFERFPRHAFVILRAYDDLSSPDADTVRDLTRKVAIFFGEDFLVTVHRKRQAYLDRVFESWNAPRACPAGTTLLACALVDVANAAILSYEPMLEQAEEEVERFEARLLTEARVSRMLGLIYQVKRRVGLSKRMLWHALQVSGKLQPPQERMGPLFQDLRETAESMHFWADELSEEVNNLLHMQLSLASHRTNEVMQVLTIFSAFFLPLTFLVGVYGMNFEFMPELHWRWGYAAAWGAMIVVAGSIYLWFRKRGWL